MDLVEKYAPAAALVAGGVLVGYYLGRPKASPKDTFVLTVQVQCKKGEVCRLPGSLWPSRDGVEQTSCGPLSLIRGVHTWYLL